MLEEAAVFATHRRAVAQEHLLAHDALLGQRLHHFTYGTGGLIRDEFELRLRHVPDDVRPNLLPQGGVQVDGVVEERLARDGLARCFIQRPEHVFHGTPT